METLHVTSFPSEETNPRRMPLSTVIAVTDPPCSLGTLDINFYGKYHWQDDHHA